jgi:hypothetical protein
LPNGAAACNASSAFRVAPSLPTPSPTGSTSPRPVSPVWRIDSTWGERRVPENASPSVIGSSDRARPTPATGPPAIWSPPHKVRPSAPRFGVGPIGVSGLGKVGWSRRSWRPARTVPAPAPICWPATSPPAPTARSTALPCLSRSMSTVKFSGENRPGAGGATAGAGDPIGPGVAAGGGGADGRTAPDCWSFNRSMKASSVSGDTSGTVSGATPAAGGGLVPGKTVRATLGSPPAPVGTAPR